MVVQEARLSQIPQLYDLFLRNEFLETEVLLPEFEKLIAFLYHKNPTEVCYELVADVDGNPIAHYAALPFSYRVGPNSAVFGLASNLLVDKDFRTGLTFFELQARFFRGYAAKGINCVYGLVTRKEVLAAHLKTGFKKISDVFVYARPYRVDKFLPGFLSPLAKFINPIFRVPWFIASVRSIFPPKLKFRENDSQGISVNEVTRFDSSMAESLKVLLQNFELAADRSPDNLNWRFFALANRGYRVFAATQNLRLEGYVVLRPMKMQKFDSLALVDILYLPGRHDIARSLLKKAHTLAIQLEVDLVATILNSTSPFLADLRSFGFLRTSEFFTLVFNEPRNTNVIPESLKAKWHITWYDHDFV